MNYISIKHPLGNILLIRIVTATLVSKANASGNQEDLQDAVCQALLVGFGISLIGESIMQLLT